MGMLPVEREQRWRTIFRRYGIATVPDNLRKEEKDSEPPLPPFGHVEKILRDPTPKKKQK